MPVKVGRHTFGLCSRIRSIAVICSERGERRPYSIHHCSCFGCDLRIDRSSLGISRADTAGRGRSGHRAVSAHSGTSHSHHTLVSACMTGSNDSIASRSVSGQSAGSRWLYFVLLGIQAAGAIMLYGIGLPRYRQVFANPAAHDPHAANGSNLLGRSGTLNFGSTVSARRYLRIMFRDNPAAAQSHGSGCAAGNANVGLRSITPCRSRLDPPTKTARGGQNMGQFSVKSSGLPWSHLSGNQQLDCQGAER